MSLITIGIVNGTLAVAIVAALAYVCRIPYRLDRFARPKPRLIRSEARKQLGPAYQRNAA